jgi:hypothetical protein
LATGDQTLQTDLGLESGSGIAADGTISHHFNRFNLATAFPEYQVSEFLMQTQKNNVNFFRQGIVAKPET